MKLWKKFWKNITPINFGAHQSARNDMMLKLSQILCDIEQIYIFNRDWMKVEENVYKCHEKNDFFRENFNFNTFWRALERVQRYYVSKIETIMQCSSCLHFKSL